MPQLGSTILPWHQKKERLGANNDGTNATYEITNAQRKKNCNRGTAMEQSVDKGKLMQILSKPVTYY